TEADNAGAPSPGPRRALARRWLAGYPRPLIRGGTEAGCDAAVWVSGLCYTGWLTRGMHGIDGGKLPFTAAVLVICLLSVLSGLTAGLYRGRHPRGSRDEMISVFIAGGLMLVPLSVLSVPLFSGQHMLRALLGAAFIALPTIVVAR